MKRLILAFALMASPVMAENVKLFVVQKDGGVIERPGNVTPQQAAIAMGLKAPPAGSTGLVLHPGKAAQWTKLSARDVDLKHGGNGTPTVQLFPDVIDPDAPPALFPEADEGDIAIIPDSGIWIGNMVSQTVSGCPAGVAEAAASQLAALDGTPVQGTIDAGFTPDMMFPQLAWTRKGPNNWHGDFSPDTGGGPVRVQVQFAVRILAPDKISIRQQINFAGPMVGNCEAFTEVDLIQQ
jgi:hypothetical protein